MTGINQQIDNVLSKDVLIRVLSEPRFNTYMVAAGHDWNRAWELYLWNARLGEAFHLPIQTVEVALRNSICRVLTSIFGPEWGTDDKFTGLLDYPGRKDLEVVRQRLRNRKLPLVNGQIVAGLSFGFWASLLQPRYNPLVWSSKLRVAFPTLPDALGRKMVAARFQHIVWLRNRISHHEPIIRLDASEEFSQILEAISWICPITGALIKPHCRIGAVIREKP